ncbi:MAG: hypothetical protein NC131_17635, partial [Roseburia sp.]|nr:hypothetical protein [Roseburia sp.]
MDDQEFFWDREEDLALLTRLFFIREPGRGFCAALNGSNEVGKTTLVRKAAEQFEAGDHPNVYYFPTSIMASSSYWGFWTQLVQDFARSIGEEELLRAPSPKKMYISDILKAYQFFETGEEGFQAQGVSFHDRATRNLNLLFMAYTQIGIHILISIDEFDVAREAFPASSGDGSFFRQQFSLSPKTPRPYRLSILIISRRRPNTIAHHMAGGSNFEDAYPPLFTLRGFSQRGMEQYFESYAALPCGVPGEERRRQICYFCGRHPGLLMKMRRLYDYYWRADTDPDPAALYRDHGQTITTSYERMTRLMREERVDSSGTKCISAFVQAFIGPSYDESLPTQLEQIYGYGFLSRLEKGKPSIYQMAGLGDGEVDYEPLSPYYVNYVRVKVLPEDRSGLGNLVDEVELEVRRVILARLQSCHPQDWQRILDNFTTDAKQGFRENLDRVAYRNDADSRNVTYSNLDVMAFHDYSRIIRQHWPEMRDAFPSFWGKGKLRRDEELRQEKDELREQFAFLNECRNCYAHNNGRVLSPQSCANLRLLCERLLRDLERAPAAP